MLEISLRYIFECYLQCKISMLQIAMICEVVISVNMVVGNHLTLLSKNLWLSIPSTVDAFRALDIRHPSNNITLFSVSA